MKPQLTISKGTEEDYNKLYNEIGKPPFEEGYYGKYVVKNSNIEFIAFEHDDEVVGGNVYRVVPYRPLFGLKKRKRIEGIMFGILPEYRGRGLGTAALYAREQYFKERYDAQFITIIATDFDVMDWFMERGYERLSGYPLSKKMKKSLV